MSQFVVLTTGLPGTGKSTASELLADLLDATYMSVGDEVRRRADRQLGENPTGKEVGDWLWAEFTRYGRGLFSRYMIDQLKRLSPQSRTVVDGVRAPETYDVLEQYFDGVFHVRVHSRFGDRFERIVERDRAGESNYGEAYLRRRDSRDRSYGLTRLWQDYAVHARIDNDGSLEEFRRTVEDVASVIEWNLTETRPP